MKTLGSYLASQRIQKGMTQEELSVLLGYSTKQNISNYERSAAPVPKKIRKKLVKILDLDIDKCLEIELKQLMKNWGR